MDVVPIQISRARARARARCWIRASAAANNPSRAVTIKRSKCVIPVKKSDLGAPRHSAGAEGGEGRGG